MRIFRNQLGPKKLAALIQVLLYPLKLDDFYEEINKNFKNSFFFAGDAFDIENIGYMQGAYFSAKRAVREFTGSKFL